MALSHSPSIVTDGLVLCLDAANRKSYPGSGVTWGDLSGKNNNGTLINGPMYNNTNGGSIVFDGINDYISTPLNIDANPVSIGAWFTAISTLNDRGIILTDDGGWDKGFEIQNNFFKIHVGNNLVDTNIQASANTWYFGFLIYTASSMEFYINGSSVWSGGAPVASSGSNVEIGRANYLNGNGSRFFQGRINVVQIYNRALNASEVLQNFNALRGRFGI